MFKKIPFLLFCIIPMLSYTQDFSALWQGHFSYLDIQDTSQGNGKIFAAAENAVFSYDTQTFEIEKLSTINGLSGEFISTIHYSEEFELLIIGYENGLMEIAFDNDDEVLTIVDIFDKPTIPPVNKKINHFNEYNGLIYISTDYGISVYDLERLEFGDTYFIGNFGAQIIVNQTVVFEDFIYAACLNGNGLKKALVTSNNLIDYEDWDQVTGGNRIAIEANSNELYLIGFNNIIYEVNNNSLTQLFQYSDAPVDVKSINNHLIVTTNNNVFIYAEGFVLISQISVPDSFQSSFTSASIDSQYAYIGTEEYGILKTLISAPNDFEEIHPSGPLLNNSFSVEAAPDNLWLTFGEYTVTFRPTPHNRRGVSHLKGEEWVNIPYESVLSAFNLNAISINPFNFNQVFVSSFHNGLLEINDDVPTILYDHTNSGLESLIVPTNPNAISLRLGGSSFDSEGVLWTATGRIERPLKSYNPSSGDWQSYSFSELFSDPLRDEFGYGELVVGENGMKWVGGYKFGLIGYNTNTNDLKSIRTEDENMPSAYVTALALDQRNQVWIGTLKGLRVLYNTGNFFSDNVSVEEIIILEDGVPKELLFQQFVSDIEVDGSNNKWVSTIGSGVFYFSSDGQQTLFHFTTDNSPLPSNNVIDLSIDGSKGVVYIATDKGLVSFGSGGSATTVDFANAFVFPNPVRPSFDVVGEKVKIRGLAKNVNIKITDIEGNLVAEAETRTNLRYRGYNLEIDGGTAYWNGKNLANNIVSTGVYLVMLSDLETLETKVLKVMVVR